MGGKTVTNVERWGADISSIEAAGVGNMYQLVSAYGQAAMCWTCDVHSSQLDCSAVGERRKTEQFFSRRVPEPMRRETMEKKAHTGCTSSLRLG